MRPAATRVAARSSRRAGGEARVGARRAAAFGAGVRLAWARLRGRSTWATVVLALVASATLGVIEHRARAFGAPDRAVLAFGRLVVPLASFAILGRAIGPTRLRESLWEVARWGASRTWLALGLLSAVGAAAALLALACVGACLGFAHGSAPRLAADLVVSGPLVALGAASYVALFAAGATFGERGGGRWVGLGGDFLLGAGSGALAVAWPRAHLANLLGAEPPLGLSPPVSSVWLGLLLLFATALVCARSRG